MSSSKTSVTQVRTISFAELSGGGKTYIGRSNGIAARKVLNLDALEMDGNLRFIVDIPSDTYNINSSYFLGLFGDSIRHAGSVNAFKEKFEFRTHGKSYKVIDRSIERALVRDKNLGIEE